MKQVPRSEYEFLMCEFNMYPLGMYWGCSQQQIQGGFFTMKVGKEVDGLFGSAFYIMQMGSMFLFSN